DSAGEPAAPAAPAAPVKPAATADRRRRKRTNGRTAADRRSRRKSIPPVSFRSIEGILPFLLQYILKEAGFKPDLLLGRRLLEQGELHLGLFHLAFDDQGAAELDLLEQGRGLGGIPHRDG